MSFVPVNPRPFLQDLVNKDVIVRLKWGETEYKGRLVVRISYSIPCLVPRATKESLARRQCTDGGRCGLLEHRQLHEHPAQQH